MSPLLAIPPSAALGRMLRRAIRTWHRSRLGYRDLIGLDDERLDRAGLARTEVALVALVAGNLAVRSILGTARPANVNRPFAA